MELIDKVRKTWGAETALEISFCSKPEYITYLPDGSEMFGIAGSMAFFFAVGYQETVFVLDTRTNVIKPLAYDFSEFIRLILACGCAEHTADIAFGAPFDPDVHKSAHQAGLKKIQHMLDLTPIPDPEIYIKTVGQVIDCSRL